MLSINADEIVGLIAAFLTTIAFLPQAVKVYRTQSTDGLSLPMYVIMFVGGLYVVVLWTTNRKSVCGCGQYSYGSHANLYYL